MDKPYSQRILDKARPIRKPGNAEKNKMSTKDKPLSSFVVLDIHCPNCDKRIELKTIKKNICPCCNGILPISDSVIRQVHEIEATEQIKAFDQQKPASKRKSVFEDKIEVGTFVFIGENSQEYMVVEKREGQYACLCVINEEDHMNGQYVQRAYNNKLVVISSRPVMIAVKKVKTIKARLAVQILNSILDKYQQCAKNAKYVMDKTDKNTQSYKRNEDGLYDGNTWDGLSMTLNHVKIIRG